MSRVEKKPTNHPCPQGTNETYAVHLSHKEMTCIANAVTGFYNVMTRERVKISAEQAITIKGALEKMKHACKADIVVVQ